MAKVLTPAEATGNRETASWIPILLALHMLTLIKSAGKFLAIIALLAMAADWWQRHWGSICGTVKSFRWRQAACPLLMMTPFLTVFLWKLKYSSYNREPEFDSSNVDVVEFLQILLGQKDAGYRSDVLDSFVSYITTEKL